VHRAGADLCRHRARRQGLDRGAITKPRIALALGDPAGIGPEIALKALLDDAVWALCEPVLVGEADVLRRHAATCGIALETTPDSITLGNRRVALEAVDAGGAAVPLATVSPEAGRATIAYARRAIALARAQKVDAVVACPHNETAVNAGGLAFDGYPGFLADETGTPREHVFLMLVSQKFRIVNVTLHVALRRALELLTADLIVTAAHAADRAVRRLGVAKPRIGVCGINPHAGEHGLFGDDDDTVVRPAVARARADGLNIAEPIGADVLLAGGGHDVYLAMYHDQAHIPIKLLGAGASSGMPIGTPVLFSSVPHGSAFDIVGKNRANPGAIVTTLQRLAAAARA
jgi:4-hydroxy-L-threonine phosphate dehydrogenase PdxA